MDNNTIAAIATAPGPGGIAVVRLSGAGSYAVAQRVFLPKNTQKKVEKMPGYTAAYGDFIKEGSTIDEGVALFFRAPHSYTGEDVVELSCHGGDAVSRALLAACLMAGARPAGPGEFTKRAFLNGKLSLTQAEAVMDLVSAETSAAATAAASAHQGALQAEIERMRQTLIQLAGHLAAFVDYPEEDVEELSSRQFIATAQQVAAQLDEWIAGYEKGAMVRRGIAAAIVGSPNVGKSTIFNLLSGFQRAIVTPVAGTTRDVVQQYITVGGIQLQLADTAGLHQTDDIVEQEGIRRSWQELESAALVIAVFDGSRPLDAEQLDFARQCAGRPALAIVNKSDLGVRLQIEQLQPYFTSTIVASATSAESQPAIEQAILQVLGLHNFQPDAAMLATQRQLSAAVRARDALRQAQQALENGLALDAAGVCLDDALLALGELSGADVSEEVINDVFSRFCVGK